MRWLLLLLMGCDPALNLSSGPQEKRTIEGCPDAVSHLQKCCPAYESYLSCTVFETWHGQGSADLSEKESRCLNQTDCSALEKAITSGKRVCGLEFRGRRCRE